MNIIFWTLVVADCGVVVGVNTLFLPLCFGVHDGGKLTRLVVVVVVVVVVDDVVDLLFLLSLFIIDYGNTNVFSDLRLAVLAFVFTQCSESSLISKA